MHGHLRSNWCERYLLTVTSIDTTGCIHLLRIPLSLSLPNCYNVTVIMDDFPTTKSRSRLQLPTGINRRYVLAGGLAVATLWLWTSFDGTYKLPSTTWSTTTPATTTVTDYTSFPHGVNPNDVFDFAPLDSEAIRTLCETPDWDRNLIFTCEDNMGGLAHIRNSILNCVRYSIAAGATLVLPEIHLRDIEEDMEHSHSQVQSHSHMAHGKRSTALVERHGPGRASMDYLFDVEHFKTSLKKSCPQLHIQDFQEAIPSPRRRGFNAESLFSNHPVSGLEAPEQWPSRFEEWKKKTIPAEPANEPIILDLETSFLQYPTHSDGHGVAHVFGDLLKPRKDLRLLAHSVLRRMSDKYELNLTLTERLFKQSYLGVHLRGSATKAWNEKRHGLSSPYGDFENQAKAYTALAKKGDAKVVYVASGNMSEIEFMEGHALSHGIVTTHKHDLLSGSEREQMEKLKWDQRAVIDFLVLVKGQQFAGVGHSAFSWNVALKRHEYTNSMATGNINEDVWSDKLSTLYGATHDYVESASCMWP